MSEVPLYNPGAYEFVFEAVGKQVREAHALSLQEWLHFRDLLLLYTDLWEGCHESRRCSRDTYPESCITKYTSIRRKTVYYTCRDLTTTCTAPFRYKTLPL